MNSFLSPAMRRTMYILIGIALIARLYAMDAFPLTDTTEARYGEIARKMAETGDWITPWFDWNLPFWGKPPLSFWLSAISMRVLGETEFAARLPTLLLAIATGALVFYLMRRERGRDAAVLAVLVLATTLLFFITGGAVVTDAALAFSITIAMVAFWRHQHTAGRTATQWGYLFFAALGLGLLAKGPVALVLVIAPLMAWTVLTGAAHAARQRLPWIGGTLLALAIAVPWYLLAEQKTPGFLRYFLLGENFARFTDPHWAGDLYGSVHTRPMGYIWVMFLVAGLPWTPWLLLRSVRDAWRHARSLPRTDTLIGLARRDPWRSYLVLWMLTPVAFFTFAGSVLATYVLPAMPALALLIADLAADRRVKPAASPASSFVPRVALATAAIVPLIAIGAAPYFNQVIAPDKTQAVLLSALPPGASPRIAYFPHRPFSGSFYTRGRAIQVADLGDLDTRLRNGQFDYVVTTLNRPLPDELTALLKPISSAGSRRPSILWQVREPRASAKLDGSQHAGRTPG
jgi:4-amino-4-deoxy-L-arabinose transferase-like glycosyltransferase